MSEPQAGTLEINRKLDTGKIHAQGVAVDDQYIYATESDGPSIEVYDKHSLEFVESETFSGHGTLQNIHYVPEEDLLYWANRDYDIITVDPDTLTHQETFSDVVPESERVPDDDDDADDRTEGIVRYTGQLYDEAQWFMTEKVVETVEDEDGNDVYAENKFGIYRLDDDLNHVETYVQDPEEVDGFPPAGLEGIDVFDDGDTMTLLGCPSQRRGMLEWDDDVGLLYYHTRGPYYGIEQFSFDGNEFGWEGVITSAEDNRFLPTEGLAIDGDIGSIYTHTRHNRRTLESDSRVLEVDITDAEPLTSRGQLFEQS